MTTELATEWAYLPAFAPVPDDGYWLTNTDLTWRDIRASGEGFATSTPDQSVTEQLTRMLDTLGIPRRVLDSEPTAEWYERNGFYRDASGEWVERQTVFERRAQQIEDQILGLEDDDAAGEA